MRRIAIYGGMLILLTFTSNLAFSQVCSSIFDLKLTDILFKPSDAETQRLFQLARQGHRIHHSALVAYDLTPSQQKQIENLKENTGLSYREIQRTLDNFYVDRYKLHIGPTLSESIGVFFEVHMLAKKLSKPFDETLPLVIELRKSMSVLMGIRQRKGFTEKYTQTPNFRDTMSYLNDAHSRSVDLSDLTYKLRTIGNQRIQASEFVSFQDLYQTALRELYFESRM